MASTNFIDPLAKGLLLMTNIMSTLRIDQLVVPEIVSIDSSSASLECMYSGAGNDVTVLWLLNGSRVYEWSEGSQPRASGLLEGRIELPHGMSIVHPMQWRRLRVLDLIPEMSGEYTCVVQSLGQEARHSKTMIVFSPEHEFELTFSKPTHQDLISFKCIAKHIYPQPDLTIEYNKIPISQQQQRVWRQRRFYDVECTAVLSARDVAFGDHEVSCRLQIPQVDYTAITKKYINVDNEITVDLLQDIHDFDLKELVPNIKERILFRAGAKNLKKLPMIQHPKTPIQLRQAQHAPEVP